MSKAHAEHNEKACDFLLSDGNFKDWVITTAFYSALHFVQNEMFPLTDSSGTVYNSFNHYYNAVLRLSNISKHKGTKDLVQTKIPLAFPQYRWLFDACMNARYTNYGVSARKAAQAKSNLTTLKTHLTK